MLAILILGVVGSFAALASFVVILAAAYVEYKRKH